MTLLSMSRHLRLDLNLASDLSSDLKQVVKWGKTWLVTFNSSKTKLLSFHHHRGTPSFPSVIMDEMMKPLFKRLIALKDTWV